MEADVLPAEIVGEDVDDVRPVGRSRSGRGGARHRDDRRQERRRTAQPPPLPHLFSRPLLLVAGPDLKGPSRAPSASAEVTATPNVSARMQATIVSPRCAGSPG